MNRLPERHLGGVEFFRLPGQKSLNADAYFDCLKILMPLFKQPYFNDPTPGFYINYISNDLDDGLVSLRLTYYTTDPSKTQDSIQKFVAENNDKIVLFDSKWTGRADSSQPLDMPEKEELAFRNFLNRNTQIALDMLQNFGVQPFRELVLKYRHNQLPRGVQPETIFDLIFSQHSDFYRQLKKDLLDSEYFQGLVRAFHGQHPGLHFLVNMVVLPEDKYFLVSPQSLL